MASNEFNLGELFSRLMSEGVRRYETHTGLEGIGQVLTPIAAETAKGWGSAIKVNSNTVEPVMGLVNVLSQHWNRLKGEPIQEQPQVINQQPMTNTVPGYPMGYNAPQGRNIDPNFKTGAPIPGAVGKQGVRGGRDIRR